MPVRADQEPDAEQDEVGPGGVGEERGGQHHLRRNYHGLVPSESVADVKGSLAEAGYLADEPAALVSFLAERLGKPVLVEGPAGVGKTELAKALSRATGRELVRLQCYEGLDEAKAMYEWNYRKQLLRIQAGGEAGWEDVQEDIFSSEFLLTRPLMQAISSPEPVVLLIDEIDKTDQEFEA